MPNLFLIKCPATTAAKVIREGDRFTILQEDGRPWAHWDANDLETGREFWRSLLEEGEVAAANELNGMLKDFEDRQEVLNLARAVAREHLRSVLSVE